MRDEAAAAARFVHAASANRHTPFGCKDPLRVIGGLAAADTDSMRLGNVFGDGQQLRHRLKGLARVVLIESGDNHAQTAPGEFVGHINEFPVKELSFINADDFRFGFDAGEKFGSRLNRS